MPKFCGLTLAAALLSSSATAQPVSCRTDDPSCQGYATFGPAAVDRCISIRGQARVDFCQRVGDSQRVLVQPGDRYCAVLGSDPVPEECTAHPITVTEPQ